MKRSFQEIVELVVFGLIAVIVGTGLLWLGGWLIGLLGALFKWIAGILWLLLTYIIPIVVIIAAVYFLFRLLQNRNQRGSAVKSGPVVSGPSSTESSSSAATPRVSPAAAPVTTPEPEQVQGLPYTPEGSDTTHTAGETPSSDIEIVDPEPLEGNDGDGSRKA